MPIREIQLQENCQRKQVSARLQYLLDKVERLHLIDGISDLEKYDCLGYYPTKTHGLILSTILPKLEHEIAHTVEIKLERVVYKDWKISSDCNLGTWTSSKLFIALAREIRVRAIQSILHDIGQANITYNSILSNPVWSREAKNRMGFGRFKTRKDLTEWAEHIYFSTRRQWNMDRIEHEWSKRMTIVNDWIATNERSI